MKPLKFILCILVFSFVIIQCSFAIDQLDWDILNPKPTNENILDIHFISPDTGFFYSNKDLFKTVNAGKTWNKVNIFTQVTNVDFWQSTGYLIGNDDILYKSTNANSWDSVAYLSGVSQLHVVHSDTLYVASENILYQSFDGGYSWTQRDISEEKVRDIYFINDMVGVAICDFSTIRKTTDGGASWSETYKPKTYPANFNTVDFVNNHVGYASRRNGDIFKTVNTGDTWQHISTVSYIGNEIVSDICFINEQTGYAVGEKGRIFKTVNGGEDWTSDEIGIRLLYSLSKVFFFNENIGYAVGTSGQIFKTTDGGDHWTSHNITYNDILDFQVFEDSVLYALEESQVFKSSDSGNTWYTISTAKFDEYHDMQFLNKDTGFIVGPDKYILRSYNGGQTWDSIQFTSVNKSAESIYFLTKDTGFISGDEDASYEFVSVTTDGGNNWTEISTNQVNLSQMIFISPDIGFGLNRRGIYITNDGGVTWQLVDDRNEWKQLQRWNDSTISATGFYNIILTSTDYGKTWKELKGPHLYLNTVNYITPNIGYAANDQAQFFVTKNGGLTWNFARNVGPTLNHISYSTSGNIHVAGRYGFIARTKTEHQLVNLHVNKVNEFSNWSAVLEGIAASDLMGLDSIKFQYGTNYEFQHEVTAKPDSIKIFDADTVSASIDNLHEYSMYQYRLVAEHDGTMYYSNTDSFRTLRNYELYINAYWPTSATEVTVGARVVSRDKDFTGIQIEYGTDTLFGNTIHLPQNEVLSGNSLKTDTTIEGLTPNQTYYFRIKATYGGEIIYSNTENITTRPKMYVNFYDTRVDDEQNVEISAEIMAFTGDLSNIKLEYGEEQNYDQETNAATSVIEQDQSSREEFVMENLDFSKINFYRIRAEMNGETQYSQEQLLNITEAPKLYASLKEKISMSSVMLEGFISPYNSILTNITFEYGPNKNMTDTLRISEDYYLRNRTYNITAILNDLYVDSTYFFRLKGYSTDSIVYSEVQTFNIGDITNKQHARVMDMLVYPNPVEEALNFNHPFSGQIEIYNQLGQRIYSNRMKDIRLLDVSAYPKGIYLLRMKTNTRIKNFKILKK